MVQKLKRRLIRRSRATRLGFCRTGVTFDGRTSCESSRPDGEGQAHPYYCGSPPIAGWLSGELPGRPSRRKKALCSAIPSWRLRVRPALRVGSHRPHSSRFSNIRQRAVGQPPVQFPPDSRDRRAVCGSVAIRQGAETVDSQSRISTAGALSKGHGLCRSLTATESRRRAAPCAKGSVQTRMTFWRGTGALLLIAHAIGRQ